MGYETKDSGERHNYLSGMVRDTQKGKPRFDLLYVDGLPYTDQPLYRLAMLMTRGAEKYGDRNWENADSREELKRFQGSGMRHYVQAVAGERDEDHYAAVLFNVMAAMALEAQLPSRAPEDRGHPRRNRATDHDPYIRADGRILYSWNPVEEDWDELNPELFESYTHDESEHRWVSDGSRWREVPWNR